jgi:hypothetical protein
VRNEYQGSPGRTAKAAPQEHQYLREWLEADEFPETEALIAAVDEGFRSSQSGKGISIEEAR